MATIVNINGKLVSRPGVYALVKSGIQNVSPNLAAGNVVIIDDGIGASYGGGAGNTLYPFDDVATFQNFVKGGELWNLGAPLFKPLPGQNGITKLYLWQARQTTAATLAFAIAAGSCSFVTKDQGLNANGSLDSTSDLRLGYAGTVKQTNAQTTPGVATHVVVTPASSGVDEVDTITIATPNIGDTFTGVVAGHSVSFVAQTSVASDVAAGLAAALNAVSAITTLVTVTQSGNVVTLTAKAVNTPFTATSSVTAPAAKFQFSFYHGTWKGLDPVNNVPYDGLAEVNCKPQLLTQSPAVSTLDQFKAWALTDANLNAGFTFTIGTGNILTSDLANNPGYVLAAGGTETYDSASWQAALAGLTNVDANFFLSTHYGTDATNTHNDDLATLCKAGKYEKFTMIGGGRTASDYTLVSVPAAQHFNSDDVILVHGDGKIAISGGFKRVHSLYKAAACLGRLAGLAVQTPLTWKRIGIDSEWDPLADSLLDDVTNGPLAFGVLATYFDTELGYTVCLEDVNTLQNNVNLVNADASSFNVAVKRITAQLNKEMAIFIKQKFFGNQTQGPNRNTVSVNDINAAVEGFLQSRIADSKTDNYILRFENVVTTVVQDNYFVQYGFVPNFEVSKIIITGVLLAS